MGDTSSILSWLLHRRHEESREQGGSLPVCLFYLRSACRAQSTPALRTHALLSRIRYAPLPGADSCPIASLGPLPQILSSRLGSGSRRHTRWASMYRIQRTNQKKRSQIQCSTKSSSSAASDRTQKPKPLRTTASTSSST